MMRDRITTLLIGLLFLVGCDQNKKQMETLKKKNKELRSKISTLETKLKTAKRERDDARELVKTLESKLKEDETRETREGEEKSITPEKYEKVIRKFHDINFEFVSSGRAIEFDQQEAWDFAARSQGFEDRLDFEITASKSIKKEIMMDIIGRVSKDHAERLSRFLENKDSGR